MHDTLGVRQLPDEKHKRTKSYELVARPEESGFKAAIEAQNKNRKRLTNRRARLGSLEE